jgi:hypothetical protein
MIILYKNADKTVSTILDRNNIQYKIDNMVVTVLDAIADVNAGNGVATYRWSESLSEWVLISKSGIDTMSFQTEELTIGDGKVIPSNVPVNNQLWDISILDGDVVIAMPRLEDIIVSATLISGLGEWNGYKIRFTYGYGKITQQIETYLDERLTAVEAGSITDFEGEL